MIRAVIDTNVLVSGLLSPSGNEALILLAIQQGLIKPCWSENICDEYAQVLARVKFSFPVKQIDAVLRMFRDHGDCVSPIGNVTTLPDLSDMKFLHCAETARAEFIVTGNKRDFPDAPYGDIQIVSAGELLDRITREIPRW